MGDSVLIHPKDIKGNRIYPTEASHHVQKRLQLSRTDVKTKLYLDAILFQRPIIQLSHMLSSYKTSSIFEESPDLLSENIFSIATSKQTFADYRHYVTTEKYETKRRELGKLGISYGRAKHFELEFFADVNEMSTIMRRDHVNQVINLIRDKSSELVFFNPQEAVDLFKETLVENNLISKKSLKPEAKKALILLKDIVENGTYFDPQWTEYFLNRKMGDSPLDRKTMKLCEDLVEASYFLSGSALLGCSIGVDAKTYNRMFGSVEGTIGNRHKRKEVLSKLLYFCGFDPTAIASLSVDSLKSIRRDPLTQRIQKMFDRALDKNTDMETELLKELAVAVAVESEKAPLKKSIIRGATLAISLLPEPIAKTSDFLKDYVDEKYPIEPLHMFATHLSNEVMKSRIREYSMKTSKSII